MHDLRHISICDKTAKISLGDFIQPQNCEISNSGGNIFCKTFFPYYPTLISAQPLSPSSDRTPARNDLLSSTLTPAMNAPQWTPLAAGLQSNSVSKQGCGCFPGDNAPPKLQIRKRGSWLVKEIGRITGFLLRQMLQKCKWCIYGGG